MELAGDQWINKHKPVLRPRRFPKTSEVYNSGKNDKGISQYKGTLLFWEGYNFLKGREVKVVMSNLEQIEAAILSLPSSEFEKLRLWFLDLDYDRWDEQIKQDIEDGKLEIFAQEAIAEFEAGHCREI